MSYSNSLEEFSGEFGFVFDQCVYISGIREVLVDVFGWIRGGVLVVAGVELGVGKDGSGLVGEEHFEHEVHFAHVPDKPHNVQFPLQLPKTLLQSHVSRVLPPTPQTHPLSQRRLNLLLSLQFHPPKFTLQRVPSLSLLD